eukprot:scaffold149_cov315-Pinguiococcus_pyrenoidosus.AAC.152
MQQRTLLVGQGLLGINDWRLRAIVVLDLAGAGWSQRHGQVVVRTVQEVLAVLLRLDKLELMGQEQRRKCRGQDWRCRMRFAREGHQNQRRRERRPSDHYVQARSHAHRRRYRRQKVRQEATDGHAQVGAGKHEWEDEASTEAGVHL